jgi:hypothetical protein
MNTSKKWENVKISLMFNPLNSSGNYMYHLL